VPAADGWVFGLGGAVRTCPRHAHRLRGV
jgi:hypothetical protein